MKTPERPTGRLEIRFTEFEAPCTGCGRVLSVNEATPRQMFDPETYRLVCPGCLEVSTVVPFIIEVPPDAKKTVN